MDVFECGLLVSCMITAALAVRARQETGKKTVSSAEFSRFQRGFLSVYYIAMTADWLQGPYVYALYSSYGFSKHNIAVLFIGGFGASMVFGTFAGVLSDRLGRKRSCMAYCFLYIVSCVTKHARDYNTLMLGRVTGGIATSLLFSAFESWLVCEHNARGFDTSLLSDSFSLMYFGNSLCAIVAGIVAQFAADGIPLTPSGYGYWHYGGYCTPFDLSLICLVVVLLIIAPRWSENFGEPADSKGNSKVGGGLYYQLMSSKIWLCGAVVSFFEGSMQPPPRRRPLSGRPPLPTRLADGRRYIFVFNWTPSFSGGDKSPPYGLIFASFMVACMGGSSLFAILSRHMSPDAVSRSRPLSPRSSRARSPHPSLLGPRASSQPLSGGLPAYSRRCGGARRPDVQQEQGGDPRLVPRLRGLCWPLLARHRDGQVAASSGGGTGYRVQPLPRPAQRRGGHGAAQQHGLRHGLLLLLAHAARRLPRLAGAHRPRPSHRPPQPWPDCSGDRAPPIRCSWS